MATTLRNVLGSAALVGLATLCAADAARSNHFILPCREPCEASSWELTSNLHYARAGHTATLLQDGRVLVAGGGDHPSSAELYDPATGTWTLTGSMLWGHFNATATLLADGRVLIAGGGGGRQPDAAASNAGTSTTEIYDPATGTWAEARAMPGRRTWHTATLLPDGEVLVAGGWKRDSAEGEYTFAYSGNATDWRTVPALHTSRFSATATPLTDGNVLVVGGLAGDLTTGLCDGEVYDERSNEWSAVALCTGGGANHSATRLRDGRVLIAGGTERALDEYYWVIGGPVYPYASLFDPATRTWSRAGDLIVARYEHAAGLLPSGDVLIAGGIMQIGSGSSIEYVTLDSSERFDVASETWRPDAPLRVARTGHTVTALQDGRLLAVGGVVWFPDGTGATLASAEIYRESVNSAANVGNGARERAATDTPDVDPGQVTDPKSTTDLLRRTPRPIH